MCNKCQNNKCSCKQEKTCGCKEVDAKCVLYNGQCLTTLNICEGEDLENIIIIIDSLIQDILNQIEEAWVAANIGGGAELYKGISSLGIHQFRTLIDSVSVKVVENENNISLAVDEAWLEEVIIRIVDDIISNIPDTELDSPLNSISITSTGTNEFELDLNPTTFASPNGSVTITSATIGGVLRINFQVNPSYINSLLPNITNVGLGAQVYKGLNGNTHEFRGITTQVTQPSTTNNQLTGTVGANATVVGNNVQVNLDFSNLRVPLQQVGIPEYYVHSAGDDNTADGSIVRPYKTWEACKLAIIGSGSANGYPVSFWNPQYSARVIFLSNITSSESLTLNRTTFEFRGDVRFTYTGTAEAVIDMLEIINAIPNNGDGTKVFSGNINISGEGTITRSMDASLPYRVIRAAGYGIDGILYQSNFTIYFISGKITILEKKTDRDTYFTESDYQGNPLPDGAGRPVWVLNKSGGNDVIPAVDGLITATGRNYPVRDCLYIAEGCQVDIKTTIQRAIYVMNSAGFINYGSIVISSDSTSSGHTGVRYGTNLENGEINQYTPSSTVSLIVIDSASFISSSKGIINSFLLGSTNQGGYNSFVELKGNNATFEAAGQGATLNTRFRYRYLLYLADNSPSPETGKIFLITNVFTRATFTEAIIGGAVGVTGINTYISLREGSVENSQEYVRSLNGKSVFSNSTLASNITIDTTLLNLSTYLMKNIHAVPELPDNATALAFGLLPGMFYRTQDSTESILKIVH